MGQTPEGVASGETVLMSKLLLKTTPPKAIVYTMGLGDGCARHYFVMRILATLSMGSVSPFSSLTLWAWFRRSTSSV